MVNLSCFLTRIVGETREDSCYKFKRPTPFTRVIQRVVRNKTRWPHYGHTYE